MKNTINHSNRDHALLSASGANRWLSCTPSARLEGAYGEKKSSPYAAEGTLAHELCEIFLRRDVLGDISDAEFDAKLEEIMNSELFKEDMLEAVATYADYCSAQYAEAQAGNSGVLLEIEQRLDLTAYVPESFGTADCCIINDNVLEVIDYKHGKGVPVYATWNRQLMLYALGALAKYDLSYDITEVRLTIIQPRIDNISSWLISVEELRNWAEVELKPKALLAFEGKGELQAGDWCRFCAVKNRCRKLYEQQLEVAKYEFKEPQLLSDEEIADILERAPQITEWLNSISAYALEQATENEKIWPGFKLVEGRSLRKWIADEDKIINTIFAKMPELSEDEVFETKLKTITAIEKLVGKKRFALDLADLTVKPQGKPTLVPLADKRPALGLEQAKDDFK